MTKDSPPPQSGAASDDATGAPEGSDLPHFLSQPGQVQETLTLPSQVQETQLHEEPPEQPTPDSGAPRQGEKRKAPPTGETRRPPSVAPPSHVLTPMQATPRPAPASRPPLRELSLATLPLRQAVSEPRPLPLAAPPRVRRPQAAFSRLN